VYILSRTAVLNATHNSSANLPSFPPDKHHDRCCLLQGGGNSNHKRTWIQTINIWITKLQQTNCLLAWRWQSLYNSLTTETGFTVHEWQQLLGCRWHWPVYINDSVSIIHTYTQHFTWLAVVQSRFLTSYSLPVDNLTFDNTSQHHY